MNRKVYEALPIIVLLLLSGCGRVSDWGKKQFYQGTSFSNTCNVIPDYIKKVVVHDQIRTEAKFVCLWASAEAVLNEYATLHSRKVGCTDVTAIRDKKKAELNNKLVFYVLSLYNVPLGTAESDWTISLCIHDQLFCPETVKPLELSPEYASFFGNDLSIFKQPYEVTFALDDFLDASEMTLFFRSITKEAQLCWSLYPGHDCACDIRRNCILHSCQEYA